MKKIIYNNKLKKFLASILIVSIFMTYITPVKVLAKEITKTGYEYSYKDWITDEDAKKYKDDIDTATIEALGNGLLKHIENSTERKAEAEKLLAEKPEKILINATLNTGIVLGNRFTIASISIKTEDVEEYRPESKKYDELLEWSTKTDEEVYEEVIAVIMNDSHLVGKDQVGEGYTSRDAAEKLLELNEETIVFTVIGANNDYTITAFEIPDKDMDTAFREVTTELGIPYDSEEAKEEQKDSADLGGILLSPVFYLINFFADAIMSNVGNIMMGEGLSLISGIGVLEITPTPFPDNTKTGEPYQVDEDTFFLNAGGLISTALGGNNKYQYPNIKYTPEKIFSGEVELLSIDFISGKIAKRDDNGQLIKDANGNVQYVDNENAGWMNIRSVISQWYQVLRMIAIIGLLSVLIYTGIKIILSSTAKDKAKYKEWIGNWFMAVAILFFMHFIMAFIISVTGEFSILIGDSCQQILVEVVEEDDAGNVVEVKDSFITNLTGLVRFMIQSDDFYIKIGYEVMYIALIFYTIKFTVVYLKRMLNMAFLTLIAPIVALTYPIDKVNDGKAQGFEMWVKEYIFNALLQPMHQIMYYILLGTAVGVAASNPIYGIVVLGFMTHAEKLLKDIFGFKKAGGGTVGGMASAFAAGTIASNIKNIARMSGGKLGKGSDGEASNSIYDRVKPLSQYNKDGDNALFDEPTTPGAGGESDNGAGDNGDDGAGDREDDGSGRSGDGGSEHREDGGSGHREDGNSGDSEVDVSEDGGDDELGDSEVDGSEDGGDDESGDRGDDGSGRRRSNEADSGKPVKELSDIQKGLKNVHKTLIKPFYDTDHSKEYNKKIWKRRLRRAALGTAIGIGAAAVQAGISITDGKYNPLEGVGTIAAGYAGAGQILKGTERIKDIYEEGRDTGNNEAIVKGAQERWADRDDVIKFNKKYKPEERNHVLAIQKKLIAQGINDPKEMDKIISYMKDKDNGLGLSLENAANDDTNIRKARVLHDMSAELRGYGINPFKADDVQKYIATETRGITDPDKKEKRKAQLNNQINALVSYEKANRARK